jgi:hypothetical protein
MTTFHCDKLCGCDTCVPLRWALRMLNSEKWGPVAHHRAKLSPPFERHHEPKHFASRSAIDPAKLAKLMAMALRRRGPSVEVVDFDKRYDSLADVAVFVDGDSICLETGDDLCTLAMPKARAKLLAIMQTEPDASSRGTCERILRGEYADPDELLNTIPNNETLERRQNASNPGRRR